MSEEHGSTEEDTFISDPTVTAFIKQSNDPEIQLAAPLPKSNVTLSFNNLSYSVSSKAKGKRGREILHGVTGYFRGNCLNVVIGPSGAGKTSLLGILAGLSGQNEGVRGHIDINGASTSSERLRKLVCYVPQQFSLLPYLTTRETLHFAAKLKILEADRKQINAVVLKVAKSLGLQNCLSTMAENLSGGERKRLSIGVEIVVNPLVLVLDEPTSGLDSGASLQVVLLLKNIAQAGCTVVCAIHQPSSQMMTHFDEMLVLARGREWYCGPQSEIVQTFQDAAFSCPPFYNAAEFVIEVVTGQRGGDLEGLRNGSRKFHSTVVNTSCVSLSNDENFSGGLIGKNTRGYLRRSFNRWINEFQILLWRSTKGVIRDNTLTKLRLVSHGIVGLFIGIVFYRFGGDGSKVFSNIACLFFFLLFLFFSNAMPAVQMFPIEAEVFAREHMNNWYGLGTYHFTKVLTDLPLQILCPTLFLAIAYFMTGQPAESDRFMTSWLVCFLLCVLSQSFGMLTGAAAGTHTGIFLVPALNIPMCLFTGFFLKLGEIPYYLKPFSFLSYFRYAFEGLLQAIYGGNRSVLECSKDFCLLTAPTKILRYMDMPSIQFSTVFYGLITWIGLLHVCIFVVLRWKSARSR